MVQTKAETPATEFLRWCKYLEDEANEFHREDWFFAQLCWQVYLIRCSLTSGKVELKFEDFLIKFSKSKEEKQEKEVISGRPLKEMDIEEYNRAREQAAQRSISEWMAALGPMIGTPGSPKTQEVEKAPRKTLPPTANNPKQQTKKSGKNRVLKRETPAE